MNKTTIVTFYFDLTNLKDSTPQIRPPSFYLERGQETLKLPYPMVIFCDETCLPFIRAMRNVSLGEQFATDNTRYIVQNLSAYDFYLNHWPTIFENRKQYPHIYNKENRNTASSFILYMFKVLAMQMAFVANFFDSTFFAWIDFGGSHIMRNFYESACKMVEKPLPKIRFCYIHFRGEDELRDMKSYYANGGPCGTAMGAFTVEASFMSRFFNGMMSIFHETLFHGVGHSEEGILTYFCHRFPTLCNFYYGDYYSILTNYHSPIEDIESIKRFFIQECRRKNRPDLAFECETALAEQNILK